MVFGCGRIYGSSLCALSVGFFALGDSLFLMGFSWVPPSNVKDVVVAWRSTKIWEFGIGSFGYLMGYFIGIFFSTKLCSFKILCLLFENDVQLVSWA